MTEELYSPELLKRTEPMKNKRRKNGFSLTEVLMAISILAIAMVFVGGLFPVGLQLSKISTEQTIAAIIADEAFAKIKLIVKYEDNRVVVGDFNDFEMLSFRQIVDRDRLKVLLPDIDPDKFNYPSAYTSQLKQYCCSALCRSVYPQNPPNPLHPKSRQVQVTVFVCKKLAPAAAYWNWDATTDTFDYRINVNPEPILVQVTPAIGSDILTIVNPDDNIFINDGSSIVDDATGLLYRVLERDADTLNTLMLDRFWESLIVPVPIPAYV